MTEVTPADLIDVARTAVATYLRKKPWLAWQTDDMLSDAMLAAHIAYQRWDHSGAFKGYAYPRIVFKVIDGLRERGRLTRQDLALPVEQVLPDHFDAVPLFDDEDVDDPHAQDPYRRVEDRMTVVWLLSYLCGREREIICRVDLCGEMQAAVGRDMGISESRVCQLRRAGLCRLRSRMMEAG